MTRPSIELREVTASNWRAVASVVPRADQRQFVADTTYYMCLAHYGDDWTSLAIVADEQIIGHVMWAYDDEEKSFWLGGLVIDEKEQGKGYGRASVDTFMARFAPDPGDRVALSYQPENQLARRLYQSLGFVETGETEDDEIVARFRR